VKIVFQCVVLSLLEESKEEKKETELLLDKGKELI
jgi:hypothetical protein